MILIADSGSTKTSWAWVDASASIQTRTTGGINPFFLNEKEMIRLLSNEMTRPEQEITSVHFYGAGCTPEKAPVVQKALKNYFQATVIEVNTDLLGAARSLCQQEEGIACILGTGSNSCHYNGTKIQENTPPLGYILGDEGSGAVLGKKLISNVLKKQLPASIVQDFWNTYRFSQAEILEKVYRQPFPNRFLATFVPFLSKHLENESIAALVENGFSEFIERNILSYKDLDRLPVHFTGSVAFHFSHSLKKVLNRFHLQAGTITQEPLPGLITYHHA